MDKKDFCENDACWKKKFSFFNKKLRRKKSFVKKKFSIKREIRT